jgi:hypothetical protein
MHQHLVHEYEEKVSLKARILEIFGQLLETQPISPAIGSSGEQRSNARTSIPDSPSQYAARHGLHQYFLHLFDHVLANRPSESEIASSLEDFERQAPILSMTRPDSDDASSALSFSDFSSTSSDELSESSEDTFKIESDSAEDPPAPPQPRGEEKRNISQDKERGAPGERNRRHQDPMSGGV